MSPFCASFLRPPVVHPANHRFFTPLFSASSELLFPQLLCFHNHLRCPLVFSSVRSVPTASVRSVLSLFFKSFVVRRLRPIELSCLSFSHSFRLFSSACSLFSQNTGGGGSLQELALSVPRHYPLPSFGSHFRRHLSPRNVDASRTSNYHCFKRKGPRSMDDTTKLALFPLVGDADPVPASLFTSYPEQANTLSLLYEVSREITSILDREELLRRVAQRVKKLVNYHVFSVMLWNEKTQHLESAFVMRYGDAIRPLVRVPLNKGLTGTAAGQRRTVRVSDTLTDPRFIGCEVDTGVAVRSELVVPLLIQDRLIGVLDLESAETHAFTAEHERMLATLASYVAIALENARLYEESRET